MYFGNNRKQLFIINIIAVLLVFILFISKFSVAQNGKNITIFSTIVLFLYLVVQFLNVKKSIDITDNDLFEKVLNEKVRTATEKIELQYKEKEAKKTEEEQETKATTEQIEKIVPKGAFKKPENYASKLLENIANTTEALQGIFYMAEKQSEIFKPLAGFAVDYQENSAEFKLGEDLNGQAAKNQQILKVEEIPESYFDIESGLGKTKVSSLYFIPIVNDGITIALIELGLYKEILPSQLELLKNVCEVAGKKINELINSSN